MSSPINLQPNFLNFYHKLWKLKLPSKITIMIWCFVKDFVPTMSNLAKRRVSSDEMYHRCGMG